MLPIQPTGSRAELTTLQRKQQQLYGRPRRRLFDVGLEWSHARRYRSVADTLALVESVTFDDLHRVLEAWPLDAPSATVLAGPL